MHAQVFVSELSNTNEVIFKLDVEKAELSKEAAQWRRLEEEEEEEKVGKDMTRNLSGLASRAVEIGQQLVTNKAKVRGNWGGGGGELMTDKTKPRWGVTRSGITLWDVIDLLWCLELFKIALELFKFNCQ